MAGWLAVDVVRLFVEDSRCYHKASTCFSFGFASPSISYEVRAAVSLYNLRAI
jgi:hypothetical protein